MSDQGTIDKDWFVAQLKQKRRSIRGLARHLDVNVSAMSRMLSGMRRMKIEEANLIASFLGAPVEEVLRHAGVAMDGDASKARIILAASINEVGEVERLPEPRPLSPITTERARHAVSKVEGQVIAAQIRAADGALAVWDDALVLFQASGDVDPSSIGCLSIVRLRDGVQLLAHLTRARKTGEAQLRLPAGELRDVILSTATPVLAVLP